jgi:hypothetical protein
MSETLAKRCLEGVGHELNILLKAFKIESLLSALFLNFLAALLKERNNTKVSGRLLILKIVPTKETQDFLLAFLLVNFFQCIVHVMVGTIFLITGGLLG